MPFLALRCHELLSAQPITSQVENDHGHTSLQRSQALRELAASMLFVK